MVRKAAVAEDRSARDGPRTDADAGWRPRCWICRRAVRADEATIAPTVCAPCYDALRAHWR